MRQEDYDLNYEFNRIKEDNWMKKKVKNVSYSFTKQGLKKAVTRRFPILKWIPKYETKNVMPDLMAGITVGIYNVPQAMSYSTLAGLPPVYGLYASFFPPLLYSIFGTSMHTSIGVYSITCLMINKCLQKFIEPNNKDSSFKKSDFPFITDIQVVTSLCLLTGLFQFLMAFVRCDKMMKFLSSPAISAITFTSCFFSCVSQLPKMCGFSVPSNNQTWFNLIFTVEDIINNLYKTNLVTLALSISSIFFLLIMKLIVEPSLKKSSLGKIPIPTELLTILTATTLSYFLELEKNYGVKTIHEIPQGFPNPTIPRIDVWPYMIMDAISIAVVAYAVTISMGQIFSKKHKYRIDSNQELLALGLINIFSSFFSTFPTSASLSRTIVNEGCGSKSQISGVISCMCILLVITFLGPLLSSLPSCVLATIVIVAVRKVLMNFQDLPKLWKYSKHDFFIWIFTAIITLISDIAQGVAAGILFAIITIAVQSQQPTIKRLGQIRPNDFRPLKHYNAAKKTLFPIIRFDAPLIFANVDKFLDNVRVTANEIQINKDPKESMLNTWTALILDCHTWTYTDSMGIDAVKEIDEDLKNMKILPLFANLKSSLRRQYENAGVLGQISSRQIYPSIQDALDSANELVVQQQSFFETGEPL